MKLEHSELLFSIDGRIKRLRSWLESGQYKKATHEIDDIINKLNALREQTI